MALLLTAFPYGRQRGIGSAFFAGGRPWLSTALALFTAVVLCWLALGVVGVSVLAASSVLALALGWWTARRLGGGLTGDCYGATNEIVEAFSLVCFAAWLRIEPPTYLDAGYGAAILYQYLSWLPLTGGWFFVLRLMTEIAAILNGLPVPLDALGSASGAGFGSCAGRTSQPVAPHGVDRENSCAGRTVRPGIRNRRRHSPTGRRRRYRAGSFRPPGPRRHGQRPTD